MTGGLGPPGQAEPRTPWWLPVAGLVVALVLVVSLLDAVRGRGAHATPDRTPPASAADGAHWLPAPYTFWTRGWVPLPHRGPGSDEVCGVPASAGATRAYHQTFTSEELRVFIYEIEHPDHTDPQGLYERFFPECLRSYAVGTGPGPATFWTVDGPDPVWYAALLHRHPNRGRAVYLVRVESLSRSSGSVGTDDTAAILAELQTQLAS